MRASVFGVAIPALWLSQLCLRERCRTRGSGLHRGADRESVSLLQGYECNITVSAGEDGIVLVDTCGARVADKTARRGATSLPPNRFDS